MQLPGGDAVSRVKNMQTHTNSRAQSNIAVNETGGPDRRQVHAALGASVRAAGESNKALKKGRIKGEMDGSGEGEEGAGGGAVVDTAHCHCYSPPAENGYLH